MTFVAANTHGAGTYDSATGRLDHRDRRQRHLGHAHHHGHRQRGNRSQHPGQPLHRHLHRNTRDRPRRVLGRPDRVVRHDHHPRRARLVQNKTVDQASAAVGATLTYSMTLANTGTGDATGVVAHDALPAGVSFVSADTNGFGTFDATTGAWTIGTIPVGATATLTVTATVEPQAAGSTLLNAFQVVEPPDPPAARRGQSLPEPGRGLLVRHHHGAGHTPAHAVQGCRCRDRGHRPDADLLHVGGQHRLRRRHRRDRPGPRCRRASPSSAPTPAATAPTRRRRVSGPSGRSPRVRSTP